MLGEYNKSASSPFSELNEAMQDTAYTTHTYKHTTIGFLADIKDMPNQYAYSKVFFDRWYRPENCTIIVAGDVKHDALVALVKQYYGGWKRGKPSVTIPAEPPQTRAAVGAADLAAADAADPLPGLSHPGRRPRRTPTRPRSASWRRRVFGETSPLYQELVLEEQKVVMLPAEAEAKRDPGLFTIVVRVRKPEDLADVRERIDAALAEAARTPIDPARLDAIKSHLRYAFAGSLDSADAVADAVGQSIATTGRPESINDLYAAYDRLTPADLQRVAGRVLPAEQRDGRHPRDGEARNDQRTVPPPRPSASAAASPPVAGSSAPRWPLAPPRTCRPRRRQPADDVPARRHRLRWSRFAFVLPRRLAGRPAGQGGPGRPDRRDGRRGGDEVADLRPAPRGVLPDGRRPRRGLPQGGHGLLGRGPPRQPRRLRPAGDRDDHHAAVRPRGLRAAPQRGARLRHQDPPRQQRRGAGQVDAAGRALPGPPLRPPRPGDRRRA